MQHTCNGLEEKKEGVVILQCIFIPSSNWTFFQSGLYPPTLFFDFGSETFSTGTPCFTGRLSEGSRQTKACGFIQLVSLFVGVSKAPPMQ